MPKIQPFPAFRYNLEQVESLNNVVAPPYDVIDDKLNDTLLARHPHNVVRLILDKMNPTDDEANNRYTRSAKTLKTWKESGVLQQDAIPAIYVYHQIYTLIESGSSEPKTVVRKGFMCRCEAVPFGEGMVFPHEITMSGPKMDRLMLTTACKMNFSQIFGLYPDSENKVQNLLEKAVVQSAQEPIEATDHLGVLSRLWTVTDPVVIADVVREMDSKPIFVADGHHRYETACNYRRHIAEQGLLTPEHPANYVLMVCIAMEDPGLIVLPTHRLFPGIPALSSEELAEKLGDNYMLEQIGTGPDVAHDVWRKIELKNDQSVLGLYTVKDGIWHLATLTEAGREKMDAVAADHHPEWRRLGVSLLHRLVIETLLGQGNHPKPTYVHLVDEVVLELKEKAELKDKEQDYALAALVMPATVQDIRDLSLERERMPAKSTYFYPKLITGMVFNPLE
ncbi:MAG: DUF1015 domain-containing protein [Thermoguttaceae bacterium]